MLIRIGSRGSRLALTQAGIAAEQLRGPGVEIALVPITTAGDRDRTRPFGEIGSRGVFVKELEEALLGGRIDVAVHSAKDMTSTDADGLIVGAYLAREDPRDALCGVAELRPGLRIGTASEQRNDLLHHTCGGLAAEIEKRFEPDELLPEAGQGALALQVRVGEEHVVAAADHGETRRRVDAERRCVAVVGGGCLAPVAAFHDGVLLTGLVAAEDGSWTRRAAGDDPEALGRELASLAAAA